MVPQWFLYSASGVALIGAIVWSYAAAVRVSAVRKSGTTNPDVAKLSDGALSLELHTAGLYLTISVAFAIVAVTHHSSGWYVMSAIIVPVIASLWLSKYTRRNATLTRRRLRVEQRAMEMLQQSDSAPARWAERLAPATLPDTPGYQVGSLHEAVSGVMSGDLVDVFHLPSGHLCCVVGDVSGHGVEASITALQIKYLLRSYLRRYRDPGQALEELNRQVADFERPEEFVSLCALVFDDEAGTVRYASAGHPPAWLSHDREMRSLKATGPLLMMDSASVFHSREVTFVEGDVIVAISDGVLEARSGEQLFGEERLAATIRRHDGADPDAVCHAIVDAAQEFSSGPLTDDVTVLAVRRI